jgi:hypothetical protein
MTFRRDLAAAVMATGLATAVDQAWAQGSVASVQQSQPAIASAEPPTATSGGGWTIGGFLDLAYIKSFNSPSNHHSTRFRQAQAIMRLEHRYDNSKGRGGGFFKDLEPGVVGLAPGQHLLIFGWILTFDASSRQRLGT